MKSPKISKDTVVRLLTIIFTPIVTGGSAWLAAKGVNLPPSEVIPIAALSGASVLALGFHWLQHQPVILKGEQDLETLAGKVAAEIRQDPALAGTLNVVISKLDANRSEILAELEKVLHAPSSIDNLIGQLVAQSQQAAAVPAPVPPSPVPPAIS